MKKWKNRFFRHRTPTYPNFFYSINLSMDKVYDTKNNFGLAIPYRKNGRKKVIFWKKFLLAKTQKHMVFILEKVKLGGRCLLFRCYLDMGCMRHGRKKYSKFVTKIPIFTYRTLVHLDSTLNHSKSCRGLFFVHSVQFWDQTDIILPKLEK